MRKLSFLLLLFTSILSSQEDKKTFEKGEWLKYRIHYGIINAGYASLEVDEKEETYKKLYHIIGKGWTIGMFKWIFKVKDTYESYIDKKKMLPIHFIRRVNEGGYIISRDIYFNHEESTARVEDHKYNTIEKFEAKKVQDMISTLYVLRKKNIDSLKIQESIESKMFFDSKIFSFKLTLLGKEIVKTKFGKVLCYKLKPSVQSGRVFETKEGLTIWISADANKIPIKVKASLAVGSLKADLHEYKGLSNPFPVVL